MTRKPRSPAARRARARQAAGDTRPYMMILREEQEADAKADRWTRGKPTTPIRLPEESDNA